MILNKTRGAGPITVTRYQAGKVVEQIEIPAPTLETGRAPVEAKRGPKPKGNRPADPSKFLQTQNWY
jgi:hypothetical protein